MAKPYLPREIHSRCPAEIRERTDAGPHHWELFCVKHQKHIQWLSPAKAKKYSEALKENG